MRHREQAESQQVAFLQMQQQVTYMQQLLREQSEAMQANQNRLHEIVEERERHHRNQESQKLFAIQQEFEAKLKDLMASNHFQQ